MGETKRSSQFMFGEGAPRSLIRRSDDGFGFLETPQKNPRPNLLSTRSMAVEKRSSFSCWPMNM